MKLTTSTTALVIALAAAGTVTPAPVQAESITKSLGRIGTQIHRETTGVAEQIAHEAERVGRDVDDKVLQPVRKVAEATAEGVVELSEGAVGIVTTTTGLDLLHDVLIQGDSSSTALSETGEDFNKAANKVVDAPLNTVVGVGEGAAELTDNLAGETAGDVVRYGSLAAGVVVAVPNALVKGILYVSEGNDVGNVVGIPLGAALLQAEAYFGGKGVPLDDNTKALLEPHFGKEILDTVRVVINDDPATLPGVINALQSELGNAKDGNHAVTIGNVIVFDRAPDPLKDIAFIAHEVHHVVQYAEYGMIGFAARYTKNATEVEQEAHNAANAAIDKLRNLVTALGLGLENT